MHEILKKTASSALKERERQVPKYAKEEEDQWQKLIQELQKQLERLIKENHDLKIAAQRAEAAKTHSDDKAARQKATFEAAKKAEAKHREAKRAVAERRRKV